MRNLLKAILLNEWAFREEKEAKEKKERYWKVCPGHIVFDAINSLFSSYTSKARLMRPRRTSLVLPRSVQSVKLPQLSERPRLRVCALANLRAVCGTDRLN